MVTNRVAVSLDADVQTALDSLTDRTEKPQSELVRGALVFAAPNFDAATDVGPTLETYHRMLASGEHVLLDVDFLHCFLDYVADADGLPDPEFVEAVNRVASFHAREYEDRFESLGELLDWLSFCGFLTVRASAGDAYRVVSPHRVGQVVHDGVRPAQHRATGVRHRGRRGRLEGAPAGSPVTPFTSVRTRSHRRAPPYASLSSGF